MTGTIIWLIIVFFLSGLPIGGCPETGFALDKIFHFVVYGITAVLFFRMLRLRVSRFTSLGLSIGLSSLFGFGMEVLQSVLPWREFSLSDEIANIAGASCFSIMYAIKDYYGRRIRL